MAKKKPKVGYQSKPIKKSKIKKKSALKQLFVSPKKKKIPMAEKIVKGIIYFALRLAIRPRKWKDPKKNIEIINRTYRRIMSSDFVYIPSSIAFYLVMAFLPILSMISLAYLIPGLSDYIQTHRIGDQKWINSHPGGDAISDVLGRFIPGGDSIFTQIKHVMLGNSAGTNASGTVTTAVTASLSRTVASSFAVAFSLLVSTWIAANGFSKLIFTQSHIYEHKYLGGYWMNKLKGMSLVIALTLFLMIALLINIAFSSWIHSYNLGETMFKVIFYSFLVVSMFFGFFLAFIMLYRFSPRYKIRFKDVFPGAVVTTLPTALLIVLFGSISSLWSYGSYGVLGAIMFIGMASLLITYFIFVGITANAAYYKTFVGSKVKEKWTLSNK